VTIQAFKVSIQEKLACLDTKGGISENTLLIFSALFIACVFNTSVLGDIANILGINMLQDYLFIASIFISLFLWILFFILLLSIFIPSKYLSLSLIVFSACIAYMQNQYHVIYDENMIRNLFETDLGEASELLSITWLLFIFLAGCLPAYCIFKSPIKKQHFIRAFFGRSLLMLGVILALLINIYAFSDNYSSLLRNNRQIRDQIIPTSFIYSTYQYVKSSLPRIDRKVTAIATDAK
jgi:lipid A ethanolaminephosphotransferase